MYRIVPHNGGYCRWRLEYRPWWWPFWFTSDYGVTQQELEDKAKHMKTPPKRV